MRLDGYIDFCGFVPEEEVRHSICSADVCLAPDPHNRYTDSSTLVKIAEYMSLSRAIVSYDLTESRVTAGDAAVYARDSDPAEFAAAIDELLKDPERRRQLGEVGRARVEGGLAWEHSERALLAAYGRATDKRSFRGRTLAGELRTASKLHGRHPYTERVTVS
jgi:glycosyltransferase involved in cell wall biosynthesis